MSASPNRPEGKIMERYAAWQYPQGESFGVWDNHAKDWTRDGAGWVFQYPEAVAVSVAAALNVLQGEYR